jgi:hypothetical protein
MRTDLAKAGITAQVYRGIDADDPDASGEQMCRKADLAKEIIAAGHGLHKYACQRRVKPPGHKRGDPPIVHECEFYNVCGYRRQQAGTPQVWLVPHQLLFIKKPAFIPTPALLVIDESFSDASLHGVDAKDGAANPVMLDLAALHEVRTVEKKDKINRKTTIVDDFATVDLHEISRRTYDALCSGGDGQVRRDALTKAPLTPDDLRAMQKLEWRRKIKKLDDVLPGMPRAEALKICKRVAKHNGTVARLARLWERLALTLEGGHERSPWLTFEQEAELPGGGVGPVVAMAWRRDIHPSWSAPTLIMDATMRPEIVREFFPRMTGPVRVSAPMPHTHIRQIIDQSMSIGKLVPSDKASEKTNDTRRNNLERLRRYIEVRADDVRHGGVLVVCRQKLEVALQAGGLPPNVETAHFNDLTGSNEWEDVSLIIMIGRTEPAPRAVERSPGCCSASMSKRSSPTRKAISGIRASIAVSACVMAPGGGSRTTNTQTHASRRCAGRSVKPGRSRPSGEGAASIAAPTSCFRSTS